MTIIVRGGRDIVSSVQNTQGTQDERHLFVLYLYLDYRAQRSPDRTTTEMYIERDIAGAEKWQDVR